MQQVKPAVKGGCCGTNSIPFCKCSPMCRCKCKECPCNPGL